MKRSVFLHLGDILRDYPYMNQAIEEHLQSVCYTIADDRAVVHLREEHNAVEKCIGECNQLTNEVIDAMYFNPDPNLSIIGITAKLNISESTLYRCRNYFLEKLKRELGW